MQPDQFRESLARCKAAIPSNLRRNQPLCKDHTEMFFQGAKWKVAELRQICQACPFQATCLARAVENDEAMTGFGAALVLRAGVWGGATQRTLRAITLKTRFGKKMLRCRKCDGPLPLVDAANRDALLCSSC